MAEVLADPKVAIARAEKLLGAWYGYFRFWGYLHNGLGVLAILLGALTGVFASSRPDAAAGLGVASAVVGGLITFLKPANRSTGYGSAWRLVSDVNARLQSEPGHDVKELNDAIRKAEQVIEESGG